MNKTIVDLENILKELIIKDLADIIKVEELDQEELNVIYDIYSKTKDPDDLDSELMKFLEAVGESKQQLWK